MPLTREDATASAQQTVDWFVGRFDPSYRLLAQYAAMPLLLTPELLNYLRNRFLRGRVPWLAEVDLLLSGLCWPVDYELYTMQPAVRAYLVDELKQSAGPHELARVARTLIHYVRHLSRTRAFIDERTLQAQQWAALVFLDDQRAHVAQEVAASFAAAANVAGTAGLTTDAVDRAELARLSYLTDILAPELGHHQALIDYAALISELLAGSPSQGPAAQQAFQADVEGVTLRVPPSLVRAPAPAGRTPNVPPPGSVDSAGGAGRSNLDAILRIELDDDNPVVAIDALDYQATARLRISRADINDVRSGLAMERIPELMNRLSAEIFGGEVGEIVREAQRRARDVGRGLRVAIEDYATGDMPWEMLYFDGYLALEDRSSLVRYAPFLPPRRPQMRPGPLRILVVDALEGAPLTKMSTAPNLRDRARRQFEAAIAPLMEQGRVAVTFMDVGDLADFEPGTAPEEGWHALHYIGSQLSLDEANRLVQQRGDEPLPGDKGLDLLLQAGSFGLAVFFEATFQEAKLDSAIFDFMMYAKLPAVARLRRRLFNEAATSFMGVFYGALANGFTLEEAMHAARRELRSANPRQDDWAMPVLHVAALEDWRLVYRDDARKEEPIAAREASDLPFPDGRREYVEWFVDRERQLSGFLKMLAGETSKRIMLIVAPAGAGKTWLIRRMEYDCIVQQVLYVLFDHNTPGDVLEIVRRARDTLGQTHYYLLVDKTITDYFADPRPPSTGDFFQDATAAESARAAFEAQLNRAFFTGLAAQAQEQKIVFFFDGLERADPVSSNWIENELLRRVHEGNIPNVMVILTSRNQPHFVEGMSASIAITGLDGFDERHILEYVERRNAQLILDRYENFAQLVIEANGHNNLFVLSRMVDGYMPEAGEDHDEWPQ